jgi:hypothetical protein
VKVQVVSIRFDPVVHAVLVDPNPGTSQVACGSNLGSNVSATIVSMRQRPAEAAHVQRPGLRTVAPVVEVAERPPQANAASNDARRTGDVRMSARRPARGIRRLDEESLGRVEPDDVVTAGAEALGDASRAARRASSTREPGPSSSASTTSDASASASSASSHDSWTSCHSGVVNSATTPSAKARPSTDDRNARVACWSEVPA